MYLKQNQWKKLAAILMVIGLFFSLSSFFAPGTVNAAEKSITIKVNGVVKKTFTCDDLEAKKGTTAWVGPRVYSTINTYPTKKWYAVEGVKLMALFEDAGVDLEEEGIQVIKVKANDGYLMTFTKKELLDDSRYYFPGLKDNHEYYGHMQGSVRGKEPVDAIIALRSVESDDFAYMTTQSCPLLIFGQRWVTEQTNHTFSKNVSEIDLLTTAPEKWASPTATPAGGTVPAGTKVVLTNEFGDTDKIYYTTDNSDPTLESPIYNWIARRWWNNRKDVLDEINKPIEITEDTTIKAITIGFGREDSDIAVFEYMVETAAVTGVSIIEGDQILNEGITVKLTAVVSPVNTYNQKVTWSTSDDSVATVDKETGLVTAVSEGEATITVTTDNGEFNDSITVTVVPPYSAALAEESPSPEQIILTWTADPTTTQTVNWLMPNNSLAWVQYLKAEEFGGNFDSAQQLKAKGAVFTTDSSVYRYTANLTGLTPDTKYIYRVGREGAWSEPAAFTTAATETESFSFLYMGDVQSGYTAWGSMLDSVYEAHPETKFVLLGGDLTDKGYDENEWGEFIDAAAGVFSRIPVMPTMGNHDGLMYQKFFALPDNGPTGLKQEFYSFDYGDAHFVILNSNNNTSTVVKQWLQQDLEGTNKKWKFAVFHHPAYPATYDSKGIDKSICENWVPILEENGVDMVFVGHQHVYMRTYPIFQGEVQTDSYGIVYVMGNAGSKTYGGGVGLPYIACEKIGSNYQVIDIDGDVLTLTSKEASGELIETYIINKSIQVQPEKPQYHVIPKKDSVYNIGATTDGIKTMIVNPNQTGLKDFTVFIEPVVKNEGTETVVFTQFRDGVQLQLNTVTADFDLIKTAQAEFDVEDGDVIKAYIVDDFNNADDFNPTILQ